MSCGFNLFPHFEITFPSVVLDLKLFSENIPNKMISRNKTSTLKNLEVATCYSKDFNREFCQVEIISRPIYLELISRKYSNVLKCVIILYCKSNNNLNVIVTIILYSAVLFGTR